MRQRPHPWGTGERAPPPPPTPGSSPAAPTDSGLRLAGAVLCPSREMQQWPGRHCVLRGRSRTRGGPAGDTEPRVRPGVPRSVPRLSFLFLACSQNKLPTRRARQAGGVRGGRGPGEGRLCTVASRSQGTDCRFSPALGSSGTGVRRPGVFASLHPDGLIPRYLPSRGTDRVQASSAAAGPLGRVQQLALGTSAQTPDCGAGGAGPLGPQPLTHGQRTPHPRAHTRTRTHHLCLGQQVQ